MKAVKIYIVIFTLLVSACKDSFLERYPTGQVSRDQLLKTALGVENALVGAYALVTRYHMAQYGMYGDVRSDNVEFLGGQNMLEEFTYSSNQESSVGAVGSIWSDVFEALNNVNNIINAIDDLRGEESASRLDSLKGQALVLRALCHFDLAQVYAQHYTYTADASHLGVPVLLKTPTPGDHVSRSTMAQTYAQILKDLTDAIIYLRGKDPGTKIKVTEEAAQAFRSRVYLYMENWNAVVADADAVLGTQKFDLAKAADYKAMFMAPEQRSGVIADEVIWQLNKNKYSPSDFNVLFSDYNDFMLAVSSDYRSLFEDGDVRKDMIAYSSKKARYYIQKHALDTVVTTDLWPINYKVIRSAELYLNRAEANWHLNNYSAAVEDLKVIRARAYNKPVSEITVSYTDNNDLLEQILTERRKELGFENQRIFDIMRNKKDLNRGASCTAAVCTVTYPNDLFVLPIPALELDANPRMQPNPGVNN